MNILRASSRSLVPNCMRGAVLREDTVCSPGGGGHHSEDGQQVADKVVNAPVVGGIR